MNYLLLGRIAKLVALLGFFLPWVTVSCSDTVILEATGWQLMTGDIQANEALEANVREEDPDPSPVVIAAFAAIFLALGASFLAKGRIAAAIIVGGAVLGAGLSYYAIADMRAEMTRSLDEAERERPAEDSPLFSAEQQRDMARAVAGAIRVEEQEGYWLTLGALGAAFVFGLFVFASAPTRRPEESPG
jgi:hypothetical protein